MITLLGLGSICVIVGIWSWVSDRRKQTQRKLRLIKWEEEEM